MGERYTHHSSHLFRQGSHSYVNCVFSKCVWIVEGEGGGGDGHLSLHGCAICGAGG